MNDPTYALQVAVAAVLLADATVSGLVGAAVYDEASAPDAAYPRIEIGDDQRIGDADTASNKSKVFSTVTVYAAGPGGRLAAKQIAAAVEMVLLQPLALTGHNLVSAVLHEAGYHIIDEPTDPSGVAAKGILLFQFRTFPNPA